MKSMNSYFFRDLTLDVTMNVYVDVLGTGNSRLEKYFVEYEKDLQNRPIDFWVLFPSEKCG